MKLALSLAMMIFTLSSFACDKYEAQFVGFVSVVDEITETGCKLSIDFDMFNEHFFCPLLQEEVDQKQITADVETCKALANSHIGGILSWDVESDLITIEK